VVFSKYRVIYKNLRRFRKHPISFVEQKIEKLPNMTRNINQTHYMKQKKVLQLSNALGGEICITFFFTLYIDGQFTASQNEFLSNSTIHIQVSHSNSAKTI